MKNAITYLCRASEDDLLNLNKSLALVDDNVLPFTKNVDLILFVEEDFEPFMDRVIKLRNGEVTFVVIKFPEPPADAPEIFPHPLPEQIAKGNMGFTIGYRHMIWFFCGGLYEQPIMQNYKYHLRLDTDSYILSPVGYDLFEMMEQGKYKYGYIEEAIQKDHPAVVEGMLDFFGARETGIEEGKMYYNNFEICEVDFFRGGWAYAMFKRLESSGFIYTKRYGDAPFRFLVVNMFMNPIYRVAVRGFQYQHGHIYDLTK